MPRRLLPFPLGALPAPLARGAWRDRRGAVALMVGVMSPMLLGFLGLTVDAGFWLVGQTRLQVAADAGAMGASYLLNSSTFKAMTAANQTSTAQAVALAEANGAMTKLTGTLVTPVTVAVASDYSSVTVTLYSQSSNYFGGIFNIAAPKVRATATATVKTTGACILALATSGNGIQVDNAGTISTTGCNIDSKSNIYLNSGTINADAGKTGSSKIIAAGTVTQSNSGSNTMYPTPATQNSSSVPADPLGSSATPTAGSCSSDTTNYTAYGTYTVSAQTWCKSMTFGGNGSTITFNPGVYFINNTGSGGDLTFNNVSITKASGVTFVITGTKPGNFTWTNNSNSSNAITAASDASVKGAVIWMACNSSGQTASFQGNSPGTAFNLSGAIYMPCAAVDIGNYAQINMASSASTNFIAKSIYVHGSGNLSSSLSGGGGTSGASALLTQ